MINWDLDKGWIDMYDGSRPIGRHPIRMADLIKRDTFFMSLYKSIGNVTRLVPDKAWLFYQLSKNLVDGIIVELGVYKGGSAKLFCELLPDREYHGWDTFSGIPDIVSEHDDEKIVGQFNSGSKESVAQFIGHQDRVTLYDGFFPDTFVDLHKPIALAHIDTDTYTGMLAGLKCFYPRMTAKGLLVMDDYRSCYGGVQIAVEEFMKDRPEKIMQLLINQAFFFKA